MTDNLTEINLEYAEFGKIFNYPGNTSDYRPLNRSDTRLAKILMDRLYNPSIANYAITRGLPFALKPPGFGGFTVVLQPLPSITNDLLFIQLQQRTELDYLIQQGLEPPVRGVANRSYTQAHITLLPQQFISNCLRDDIAIYEALLFGKEGQFALEDYGRTSQHSSVYEPREIPRYISLQRGSVSYPHSEYVKGITNLLSILYQSVSNFGLQQQSRQKKAVFVIPEFTLSQRLAIMQEVQKRLNPLLGIVTFALDYAIAPESQVYLCNDEPAPFYLNRPSIYDVKQIKAAANLKGGYSDVYENLGYESIFKSVIPKYYMKGSSLEDAITIDELVNGHTTLDWDVKISKFIQIVSRIDENDVLKIFESIALKSELNNLLDKILKSKLRVEQRQFLCNQILIQLKQKFPATISKFTDSYLAIKANEVESQYIERHLLDTIKDYPEQVLEEALTNSNGALLYELLIVNKHKRILLEDNRPLVKILFEKPSKALYNAISRLHANNGWTVDYQNVLYEVLSDPYCAWTDEQIGELIEVSNINLPNLGLHRLKAFLNSTSAISHFLSLPNSIQAEQLKVMIEEIVREGMSLFNVLNKQNSLALRNLAVTVCNSNDIKNVSFSKYWIEKIAILESSDFMSDLNQIIENYKVSQPQFFINPKEKLLYQFLRGEITVADISIQLCQEFGIERQYLSVLKIMLQRQEVISLKDICHLITELPVTNALLADIIKNSSQYPQAYQIIISLDVLHASQWLSATQQESLRSFYLDSNSNDLLYQMLFNIIEASPDYLITLLTNEFTINKKMYCWDVYLQMVTELLNARENIQSFKAVNAFKDMIIEARESHNISKEIIFNIGQLALFAFQDFSIENAVSKKWLTYCFKLANTEEWFEHNQIARNQTIRYYLRKGLVSLGKSLNPDSIEAKYDIRIICIVANIIDSGSKLPVKQNNFKTVADRICPKALESLR